MSKHKFRISDPVRVTAAGYWFDWTGVVADNKPDAEYPVVVDLDRGGQTAFREHELILADAAGPFTFEVAGTAAPQGSKKGFQRGKGVVLVEMSKNLPSWRAAVVRAATAAFTGTVMDCPVSVQATFRIPKPKSTKFREYPAGPPDTDKLQRAVGDALKIAGIITDDSRIVHWDAAKVWGSAGATITITEMSQA